jgi:hypothetical protein
MAANLRKQYHFRAGSGSGLDAWDVDGLIVLAAESAVEQLPVAQICELDTDYWFGDGSRPSVRDMVGHFRLMLEADPSYPIIIDPDGGVMDGMHRVARALAEGRESVPARRLRALPPPDFRDCHPEDLPY